MMKHLKSALLIGLCAAALASLPTISQQFQPGQLTLTGFPTQGRIPIDNGGPVFTNLSEAAGTVTLNGATPVTVTNSAVTAGSVIIFTLKTVGGTVGAYPVVATITPGTGFTVKGTALDTSIYNYVILG